MTTPHATDSGVSFLKTLVKRYPRLYRATVYIFGGQPQNTTAFQFVARLPLEAKVLNVGSGSRKLRSGTINIDVIQFEGVDIVADAEQLPYSDASIDAIVLDNVLEHTRRPHMVIQESLRVLKPGGKIYVAVPFVIPYHSSPGDFYRWSEEGVRELLQDFKEDELKIQYGPSAAFTMILSEWLALLLSFNIKSLHTALVLFFTVITAPLKLFDYLLSKYSYAHSMPLSFYFIGTKK
jgi:ubiquinone/menaquinone biosynthesis C-methylase UbiE